MSFNRYGFNFSFQDENHKLLLRWTTQVNLHILVEVDLLRQVE